MFSSEYELQKRRKKELLQNNVNKKREDKNFALTSFRRKQLKDRAYFKNMVQSGRIVKNARMKKLKN